MQGTPVFAWLGPGPEPQDDFLRCLFREVVDTFTCWMPMKSGTTALCGGMVSMRDWSRATVCWLGGDAVVVVIVVIMSFENGTVVSSLTCQVGN